MRIAVVQFPGSTGERETILAVERAGMQAREFLWNEPLERLAGFDGFIITGSFSYQDHFRAGIITAFDPIMQSIKQQSLLGKPVLGICGGAQMLVEAGLVPGLEGHQVGMALTDNKRIQHDKVLGTGSYNASVNICLSAGYQWNAFTRCLPPKKILQVPVAHGEGRFVIPPVLLAELERNGLHVFQYCDENGAIRDEFPINPNGSMHNIAAIANKAGNVMAIMPHLQCTLDGEAVFKSMRDYIASGHLARHVTLHYQPRIPVIKKYQIPEAAYEWIVGTTAPDNHAISMENALQCSGIPIKISRSIHWEVRCDSLSVFEKIKLTDVLSDDYEEKIIQPQIDKNPLQTTLLVRDKENIQGWQKLQTLRDHFNIEGIQHISRSVLWHIITSEREALEEVTQSLILWNPYAHDCYYF